VEYALKIHFLKIHFIFFISTWSSPNFPLPQSSPSRTLHQFLTSLIRIYHAFSSSWKFRWRIQIMKKNCSFLKHLATLLCPTNYQAAWYIARDLPFLFQSAFYYLLCLVPLLAAAEAANSQPVFYSSHLAVSPFICCQTMNWNRQRQRIHPSSLFVDHSLKKTIWLLQEVRTESTQGYCFVQNGYIAILLSL